MLADFVSWWSARMVELLPSSLMTADAAPDGIVIAIDQNATVTALHRRNGREEPIALGTAARFAARRTVLLRPASGTVLQKQYVVPTAPHGDLDQMLRYDLARVTPFPAQALFWRWDGRPKPTDRCRTEVVLTMVPKIALAATMDRLAAAGIAPHFLEMD